MSRTGRIHWRVILLAGLFAELAIFVVFFALLAAAALAGVPELARPESTLDLIDAMVSGFVMMFLFTGGVLANKRSAARHTLVQT